MMEVWLWMKISSAKSNHPDEVLSYELPVVNTIRVWGEEMFRRRVLGLHPVSMARELVDSPICCLKKKEF